MSISDSIRAMEQAQLMAANTHNGASNQLSAVAQSRIESTTKSVQDLIGRVEELRGEVGPLADRLLGVTDTANPTGEGELSAGSGQIDTLDGAISELRDGLRRLSKQVDRLNVL